MPGWEIEYHEGGIHFPRLGLWCDAAQPVLGPGRVFVSHAHADHIGRHRSAILSAPTSALMADRLGRRGEEVILAFGEPREFRDGGAGFWLTLLPAGHIFGSAMAWLESEAGTALYTGDFKLRQGLSAEQCQPRPADVLIMEATYGRPHYLFPPASQVMQGVIRFCRDALHHDETPVLLGYSLGKSQELLCGLAEAGLPIALHAEVYQMTKIYERFGRCFPAYERYERGTAAGKVLLAPPSAAGAGWLRNLGKTRMAALTGWAVDSSCRHRRRADAAFPLSDHADFSELIEMVRRVQPKQVFTLHGFAAELAQALRELGYPAQALSEPEQLTLPLAGGRASKPPRLLPRSVSGPAEPGRDGASAGESAFGLFAAACQRIGGTSKKTEKSQALAEYLKKLEGANLERAVNWFTGRPFSPLENKPLQLGWALIRDALCAIGELDEAGFGMVYLKHSDLGETAAEILAQRPPRPPALTLERLDQFFLELHAARGSSGKLPVLIQLLELCAPEEAKYVLKILTGDLRIGLKEGLVEEGVALAFGAPIEEVRNANLLLNSIGATAQLARRGGLGEASLVPFRPVKYMLASPEATAAEAWQRVKEWFEAERETAGGAGAAEPPTSGEILPAPEPFAWREDKYDGVRCQLHKVGQRVELYSRDLREMTGAFAEIADAARTAPADFILDGEVAAMREGKVLPFAELQRRLGRKESDFFLSQEAPARFIAFDLLWCGGQTFLDEPLRVRRRELEKLWPMPETLLLAEVGQAHSPEELEAAFEQARRRGNEGLMIKDPSSLYTPGRRGLSWLKMKRARATLDCVVVGAEYGHGKRKAALSDYTFAVRDQITGGLRTIGKAYSGLTDAEIAALTRHFLEKTVRQHGRYFEVEPDTVIEVAFDAIQKSNRHSSGLALRFPRIVRIRPDKSPAEIDTLQAARRLAEKIG